MWYYNTWSPSVIVSHARKTSIITQPTQITTSIIIPTAILPHVEKITITIIPWDHITLFGFVGLGLERHNLDYRKNIISKLWLVGGTLINCISTGTIKPPYWELFCTHLTKTQQYHHFLTCTQNQTRSFTFCFSFLRGIAWTQWNS
jgi:hypothetical protein